MDALSDTKVALVWRGEWPVRLEDSRFAEVAAALRATGLAPEACVYDEARTDAVRAQLQAADAALVWVNPLQDGKRRYALDSLLREAVAAGVRVSAHPDVIDKLGVKAVLWRTRDFGWGSDVHFYETLEQFAAEFPTSVAAGPRVLKPNRGNGGHGVWKVAAAGEGLVRVQAAGDPKPRTLPLGALFAERAADFSEAGGLVDQAYQPRLTEGMVRVYLSGGRVAGFGHQLVRALAPAEAGPAGPRLYSGPDDARFQRLRRLMEETWTPALIDRLQIPPDDLPAIWDADFLLGSKSPAGEDCYVLCEINVSSVFPIPGEAPQAIAETLHARLAGARTAVGATGA